MSKKLLCAVLALFLAYLASGCATVSHLSDAAALEVLDPALAAAPAEQPQGKYIVEIRPDRGERQRVEVPFSGVPYVQDALTDSGALDKFRRMNVEVLRTAGGRRQKMRSSYDHVRKQVPIEWDYALYPDDIVVITEDPSTVLDDMLESALGPVAFLLQK